MSLARDTDAVGCRAPRLLEELCAISSPSGDVTGLDRMGISLYACQNNGGTQLHPEFRELTATLDYSRTLDWNIVGATQQPPSSP